MSEGQETKKTLKIGVTGMTCAACSSAVERILNRTKGVDSAIVSLATNDAIWFGTDDTELIVFEDDNKGKYIKTKLPKNFMVNNRMHLNREQVKELLPILETFVKTGNIENE